MRTTVNLDPTILERAKVIAAESGSSLSAVIEEAVRESMARRERMAADVRVALPVDARGGGLQPGIDLDDSASLLDAMDRGHAR